MYCTCQEAWETLCRTYLETYLPGYPAFPIGLISNSASESHKLCMMASKRRCSPQPVPLQIPREIVCFSRMHIETRNSIGTTLHYTLRGTSQWGECPLTLLTHLTSYHTPDLSSQMIKVRRRHAQAAKCSRKLIAKIKADVPVARMHLGQDIDFRLPQYIMHDVKQKMTLQAHHVGRGTTKSNPPSRSSFIRPQSDSGAVLLMYTQRLSSTLPGLAPKDLV
jgi:hypothetical protein